MRTTDDTRPRRSSFTQYLSLSHHHNQIVRKRAQSLNAQAERKNSILRNGHSSSSSTDDANNNNHNHNSLSSSTPVSKIAPSSSSPLIHTHSLTFTEFRWSSKPKPKSQPKPEEERRIAFIKQERPPHKPGHLSFTARKAKHHENSHVATHKRRIGRISKVTGKLYYTEELEPQYSYRSTRFSPPPLPFEPYDDECDFESSPISRWLHLFPRHHAGADSSDDCANNGHDREGSPLDSSETSTDSTQSRSVDPLYTTWLEKLTAHWGVFTLNMRFSMFRAQDKFRGGVAWMGDMVRRARTRGE